MVVESKGYSKLELPENRVKRSFAGYKDYFDRGPWVPFMRARRSAGESPIQMIELEQPAGAFPDPPMPDLSIQVCTKGVFNGQVDMGLGRKTGRFGPGSTVLAPPDTATDYVLDGAHGLLVVAIPFARVRDILEHAAPGHSGDFGVLHDLPFYDPLVEQLCWGLWCEAEADSPRGRLFADAALNALATTLVGRSGHDAVRDTCGACAVHIRRAVDYLHANLTEDISLDELASVAGLSPVHFGRTFKAALGATPHQYLLQCRVERAKTMLATTNEPIVQIALDCGFCHQSHLTTVFHRIAGVTPGTYRKAMRG